MRSGAGTPEELETLLEDAFVLRDRDAVALLFENDAVLVAGSESAEARGAAEIARLATVMWDHDRSYVAAPRRVIQVRDTTVVIADCAINVLRRGSDGRWRYAIVLLDNREIHEERNR